MTLRLCVVCGQPCQPHERNTDGTYAHNHCLRTQLLYPDIKKKERT